MSLMKLNQSKLEYELKRIETYLKQCKLKELTIVLENLDSIECYIYIYNNKLCVNIDDMDYYLYLEYDQENNIIHWDINTNLTFNTIFYDVIAPIKEYRKENKPPKKRKWVHHKK